MSQLMGEFEDGRRVPVIHARVEDGRVIREQSGGADGLLWAEWVAPTYELSKPARFVDHVVGVTHPASPPATLHWEAGGDVLDFPQLEPGAVFVRSQQLVDRAWWRNAHLEVVSFSQAFLESVLPEPFRQRPIELRPIQGGRPDPYMTKLIFAIGREVRRGMPGGRLCLEDLGGRVALRSVTRFALDVPRIGVSEELRRHQLADVIDYIECHLDEDIFGTDLAGVVKIGYHALKSSFKKLTGQPLYQYVIGRRLERAALLLRTTQEPIERIAFAVGYNSHAHFTDAFRRRHKRTPVEYRAACN
jgi:AraC-like DNA-binding protein